MSGLKYSVVDAFTTVPFKGNGAAIIVLDPNSPAFSDATLQQIAAEFNLAETAFVTPTNTSKGRFKLRWFSPTVEVALCGHATLAAASVLFSSREYLPESVEILEFESMSGTLTAHKLPDGRIELEFPAGEVTATDDELHSRVVDIVRRAFSGSVQPTVRFVGIESGVSFDNFLLIEVGGIDLEAAIVQPPVFTELAPKSRAIIVTQRGRSSTETFASRVFAPTLGIPEDPVTGSAHCLLGPYWGKKLQLGTGEMFGRQVSPRGGEIGVIWDGKGTCRLRGHATLVAKGELYLLS